MSRKPKERLFIDMSVDEQADTMLRHAFDGLVKGGLEGMRRGMWVYLLTIKNQQDDKDRAKVTRKP